MTAMCICLTFPATNLPAKSSLIGNSTEGGCEATAKTRSGDITEFVGECDKVDVRVADFDVFSEGAPLRKPGLSVVIADLRMTAAALTAGPAAAAERHSDSLTGLPQLNG
ncbi:MAG: hypothetical protein RL215_1566, partial [Planctomycetota bacterium]